MKRMALIIGNPGESGASNFCRGVDKDLENYRSFLTSPVGGSWYTNEVTILRRPSAPEARAAIQLLKTVDYSFAVFCGHGHTDAVTRSLRMELKTGHELSENEMRQGALRHTVVFDCCRAIATSVLTEERMMKALAARAHQNASQSRSAFDAALQKSQTGLVALFACSIGETAGDDERAGGYYSSSLFVAAQNWSESGNFDLGKHSYYLSVADNHTRAETLVHAKSGNRQHPMIEKPRSEPYFPFAIAA